MKVTYRYAESKEDGKFKIPVIDVRDGVEERRTVNEMCKTTAGSKFIPAKYGYGPNGQRKY